MSERLDKLKRLQAAVDAMWAAAREADDAFETLDAADLQSVIDEQDEEIARLKAEVERLRKAGDSMENELFRVILMELPGLEKEDINNQYIADWRAAKGVQP